jgi:hypothetical protein
MACEELTAHNKAIPTATPKSKQKAFRDRVAPNIRLRFGNATRTFYLRGDNPVNVISGLLPWSMRLWRLPKGSSGRRTWVWCMTSIPRPRGWCWWTVYAVALEFAAGRSRARVRCGSRPRRTRAEGLGDDNPINSPALAGDAAVAPHPPPQHIARRAREIYCCLLCLENIDRRYCHGVHRHAVHVQEQDDELFPIAVRSKECNTSRAIDCHIWWISKHEVVYRTRFCGLVIAFYNRR